MVGERYLLKATVVTHLYFEGKVLLCWGFADLNLGTPLLQCQVPTGLGESDYVKPNIAQARIHLITSKDNIAMILVGIHAQVKR